MTFEYKTQGTCSVGITFDIDDEGKLHNVNFLGGCPGNTAGVSKLAEGCDARAVADMLRGTPCRTRGTSCPDQLSKAIDLALAKKAE